MEDDETDYDSETYYSESDYESESESESDDELNDKLKTYIHSNFKLLFETQVMNKRLGVRSLLDLKFDDYGEIESLASNNPNLCRFLIANESHKYFNETGICWLISDYCEEESPKVKLLRCSTRYDIIAKCIYNSIKESEIEHGDFIDTLNKLTRIEYDEVLGSLDKDSDSDEPDETKLDVKLFRLDSYYDLIEGALNPQVIELYNQYNSQYDSQEFTDRQLIIKANKVIEKLKSELEQIIEEIEDPAEAKEVISDIKRIKKYSDQNKFIFYKSEFSLFVREIAQDFKNDLKFEPQAIEAIQVAAEDYLIKLFEGCNKIVKKDAIRNSSAKRRKVDIYDIQTIHELD